MNEFNFSDTHIRYNPLSGEWILVSPGRLKRPWQAEKDKTTSKASLPSYDKNCYMCPGNVRANGIFNPDYKGIFIFDNDYPALIPNVEHTSIDKPIYRRAKTERGICRVICYSHEHNKTFSDLDNASIEKVIEKWIEQINELYSYNFINYIQIFENRGGVGNSNPHPHGQIWAVETIPDEIRKEIYNKERYLKDNNSCLICDIAKYEKEVKDLVVFENNSFITIVPFWAVWPF
ncbi:MAG: galactose-1-phosphate uridylyltransferase, partial [Deferribacterota bacterium]|nr:galactose-1-phosphate uridylyltransferase [Deferribacterota bacterium]